MLSNKIKEKKAEKVLAEKKNDVKLYRLFLEFALAVVAVFLAIAAGNNQIFVCVTLMPSILAVTGILFALSAIYYSLGLKKNVDNDLKVITRAGIFGNLAVLFASAVDFYLFSDAQQLVVSIIAVAIMYFVYNIFGGEFFSYTIITGLGFICLQLAEQMSHLLFGKLIIAGAPIAAVVLFVLSTVFSIAALCRKSGKLTILGFTVATKKSAPALLISGLIILAGAAITVFVPTYQIYSLFALLACYIVTAIFYTVKLI